ncbi:transcription antitermination factor NusB [Oceanotoga sp. DSM 15011]|uniref:Transcription antitermination protein NusB n=1 Tax=Oceanotoga teriensis TaxID=515440 RepID=A0AA45HIX8_9BACT|nr:MULTISPECIES: transcription antitermination factor NusB [Oceanotoga]MDN5341843.1 transcription antitermination protein NusB [Oceanotoga sp.]MDO7976676.1 transcription antitermination factor NusB [Oceanotoga teriensis]PWJ95197.1 NusB antitermination factor [Oceanotoga teriensis]UYP00676.1 transcription antitermination factor NusB [Oceanotoga sp. DSM 15011]
MNFEKTKIREAIIETIFQINFLDVSLEELEDTFKKISDKKNISEIHKKLGLEYIEDMNESIEEIDKSIKRYLKNWKFERIGNIEKSILRLSIYEMYYRDDIPFKVSIDESLKILEKYGDDKSIKFVNGILDSFAKENIVGADNDE